MSTSTTFSLVGKGLKLNTAEDIKPHIAPLVERQDWTEVQFAGNTIGVEAAEALADALRTQKSLKVRHSLKSSLTHADCRLVGHLHLSIDQRDSTCAHGPLQCPARGPYAYRGRSER